MGDRNYPYASIGLPKLVDALGDGSKTIDSFREPGLEGVPKAKKRKMRTETDSTSNLILHLPTDILATILSRSAPSRMLVSSDPCARTSPL
ncbi:unnamed protein product [Arabidopsis arenosa]|uniref:F-box domain-containing protein n=1 Tax=Arabidopsis arenosa TaxID=38785 RepID=A0A8S2AQH3_ARAAE|nr:unnamed protein product [Arabidopsis arenosa]